MAICHETQVSTSPETLKTTLPTRSQQASPSSFPCVALLLLQLCGQRRDLIQQRAVLTSAVLEHLIPQVIDLKTRLRRRVPLRRLDPANLHLQEKLRHLDRKTASDAANASLGREIHVQRVLEKAEVGIGDASLGGEVGERKLQGRLLGPAEVDLRERRRARGHVRDPRDRGRARRTAYRVPQRGHHVGDFLRQGLRTDHETR